MFDLIRENQLDIMLALSAACMSFAILLFFTKFISRRRKLILITMEFLAIFLLYFDRMAYVYAGDLSDLGFIMVRVTNFFVFMLTNAIVLVFNCYLIDHLVVECKITVIPKRLKLVNWITIAGMALVVISIFNGMYFYFDEANQYHRGKFFAISYIVPVLSPLIQYTVIRHYKRVIRKLIYISMLLYIFVPIISGFVQFYAYGISIINMSMVLVSISLYIFTYLDINEMVMKAHRNEMVELKNQQDKVKNLFDQTSVALVTAVEKKNSYSEGYSKRVATLAKRIAVRLGKDEEECEKIYYSALFHNVGMVGIPEAILNKEGELSEAEHEIVRKRPAIGRDILSNITEYPYLKEAAYYFKERYDGSGYPEGLKGNEIPESARIIALCHTYVSMTMKKNYHNPIPYQTVREEFIKQSGKRFDPELVKIMTQIMDEDNGDNGNKDIEEIEGRIDCGNYRETVTTGIPITSEVKIEFTASLLPKDKADFSAPSIIVFDSYDRHVHNSAKTIEAYRYLEYCEIWFDGHYVSTGARNMEVSVEKNASDDLGIKRNYEIFATRYEDHVSIKLKSGEGIVDVIIALPDKTKASYIGITGENCNIRDIGVKNSSRKVKESDIRKIAEHVNYVDRMESDVPNVQIDRFRSLSTEGIRVEDGLRIDFHTMTLPSANLIWHCPYIVLYTSEDGRLDSDGYKEYVLIKINGEETGDEHLADNKFSMKKLEKFKGWDSWKDKNKQGLECKVEFRKKGNKITVITENLGIAIENTTIIKDGSKDIYVTLTGDQVALTDIRVM